MNSKRLFLSQSGLLWVLTVLILGAAVAVAEAGQAASPSIIKPTLRMEVSPAQVRTRQQREAAAAWREAAPKPSPRRKPFFTRVDAAVYRELKSKVSAPSTNRQAPAAPRSAAPQTSIANPVNFDGVDANTALYYPPDTHGAAGLNHFAQVTNEHLDIYEKAAPHTLVGSIATADWLGVAAGSLANPRMVYDPVYNRWIFLVTQFRDPAAPAEQYLYLAVSLTADPLGDYYVYALDVSAGSDTFWGFPQLGLDREALIVTGDLYDGYGYVDSRMFAVAKSLVYAGQGFTSQLFTGLVGTLAPPIVLDANPNTYLVAADYFTSTDTVTLYTLTNSATSPALTGATIPVPTFSLPPYAPQPGTDYVLDTLDGRFLNAGTQIGNSLFQVHTIDVGGYATPRFYEFDPVNQQVIQSGNFFRSDTSHDFNATIAANRYKDVFVTWSSTDPTNNVNAEVRYSGRLHSDPLNVIPSPGYLLYGSAANLTGEPSDWDPYVQRWGDYSAVSLDPADATGMTAWIVNERILDNYTWGSRIGSIKLSAGPTSGNSMAAIQLLLLSQ